MKHDDENSKSVSEQVRNNTEEHQLYRSYLGAQPEFEISRADLEGFFLEMPKKEAVTVRGRFLRINDDLMSHQNHVSILGMAAIAGICISSLFMYSDLIDEFGGRQLLIWTCGYVAVLILLSLTMLRQHSRSIMISLTHIRKVLSAYKDVF